jgi:hypothetical protein
VADEVRTYRKYDEVGHFFEKYSGRDFDSLLNHLTTVNEQERVQTRFGGH